MMIKRLFLLFYLLLLVTIILFIPKPAQAFSCTSAGVSAGGAGTFNIPVNVTLTRSGDGFIITDLAQYTTCDGITGPSFYDALRIYDMSISPLLMAKGYSGFIIADTIQMNAPIGISCVWPNTVCGNLGNITSPLKVKIGMRSTSLVSQGITIPQGTEIASISVQQRSVNTWGWNKIWKFVLASPLIIPNYTCNAAMPNSVTTVTLPPVDAWTLRNGGGGRYSGAKKTFNIILDCTPETLVSVTYSGSTMSGKDDVLVNTTPGNDNVGIQVFYGSNALTFNGPDTPFIASALATQTLSYDAYYYYRDNNGGVRGGLVTASALFTFNYK
ncbi:fimbrial protein [Buttiauxella gaviniae]|uniref:fimbrial protein n=1 Tax=Buttiauxella gaviniae TaxID=82990 RepID=UPI0039750253